MRTTCILLAAIFSFGTTTADDTLPKGAVWITPEAVISASGPAYGTLDQPGAGFDTRYGAARAIDDNRATHCCLLDDSPGEPNGNAKAIPPGGSQPVTGRIVFDLGRSLEVVAVKLTSRDRPNAYGPKNVDLFRFAADHPAKHGAAAPIEKDADILNLVAARDVPRLTEGAAETIACPPVRTRYLGLKVNDSYEAGPVHYNFQLSGFQVAVCPSDEDRDWLAEKARSRKLAGPLGKGIDRLRKAIHALHIRYPEDYRGAAARLERLQQIENRLAAANEGESSGLEAELTEIRRRALLAHPLLCRHPVVFVVRRQYAPDHHNTGTMFQPGEINAGSFRGGGAIKTLDLAQGGKVATLLEVSDGVARDLEVHFDGQTLLFAMRHSAAEPYAIYEMAADGTNLRQLTRPVGATDIDPCYLPDGRIAFASTRDGKFCGCNRHIQANLFVMAADGTKVRQIGRNNLFESRPSVLSDGRILYDRWEYVDRHFGPSFGLWTVRPDGTNHALYFGNNAWAPGAIFDAREIPGTQQVAAIFSSCHDRPWGAMVVLDRRLALDGMEAVVHCWPPDREDLAARMVSPVDVPDRPMTEHPYAGRIDTFRSMPVKYEDPYPLDEEFFLCSRMTGQGEQMGIYLVDVFGNELLLHAEAPGCFDPMPLAPRSRPPVLPEPKLASGGTSVPATGAFYVSDVYRGSGMEQVPRGTVRWLRVVEAPPKRHWSRLHWHIDTHQAPAMNFNCTNNKPILGDVRVEADGSAYFEAPSGRFLFFQLLDADKMMVQSMRSGTTLQPGEHIGCVGCHEPRLHGPGVTESGAPPLALQRPAKPLIPWYGPEREFNYLSEVQPVFDRHCTGCHDYGKEAGTAVNLAADLGLVFNTSYLDLRTKSPIRWRQAAPGEAKPLVSAVDDGPPQVLPPYAWGSHRSRLIDLLRADHYKVKLSAEEFDRIVTWIDLNAPYYGSYATSYPEHPFGRSPLSSAEVSRLASLTGVPLDANNTGAELLGSQVSFTRPELSPCLAGLAGNDPRRREALAIIQKGSRNLLSRPREDMSNCGKTDEGFCDLRTALPCVEPVVSNETTAHHGVEDQREYKE